MYNNLTVIFKGAIWKHLSLYYIQKLLYRFEYAPNANYLHGNVMYLQNKNKSFDTSHYKHTITQEKACYDYS